MRADTSEASLREALLGVGGRDGGNNSQGLEAPLLLYPFPDAEYLEVRSFGHDTCYEAGSVLGVCMAVVV